MRIEFRQTKRLLNSFFVLNLIIFFLVGCNSITEKHSLNNELGCGFDKQDSLIIKSAFLERDTCCLNDVFTHGRIEDYMLVYNIIPSDIKLISLETLDYRNPGLFFVKGCDFGLTKIYYRVGENPGKFFGDSTYYKLDYNVDELLLATDMLEKVKIMHLLEEILKLSISKSLRISYKNFAFQKVDRGNSDFFKGVGSFKWVSEKNAFNELKESFKKGNACVFHREKKDFIAFCWVEDSIGRIEDITFRRFLFR